MAGIPPPRGARHSRETQKEEAVNASCRSRVPLNQACRGRDVRHGEAMIGQLGHARVPWIRARGTMCGFHRRGGSISAHVVHRGEFVDRRGSVFFWALELASWLQQKKVLSNCEMEYPIRLSRF